MPCVCVPCLEWFVDDSVYFHVGHRSALVLRYFSVRACALFESGFVPREPSLEENRLYIFRMFTRLICSACSKYSEPYELLSKKNAVLTSHE